MRIIIFLTSLLILCSINLENCQGLVFPTAPLNLTTESPPPLPTPTPTPPIEYPSTTSLAGFPESSQATFPDNSIPSAIGNAINPIQSSPVIVLSTTTEYVGPASPTLSPTETVVAYVTANKKSSCNKILLNLWNIGIFNIISIMALWFN